MFVGIKKPQKFAIFISGSGSTLQSLLEMHHQINISLIVTNRKNANGILKAKRFGKQVLHFDKNTTFENLNLILLKHNITHIILAGFMKLLPQAFVEVWKNKIFNIHPSLLPMYPGLNSAQLSWSNNDIMGVTIHEVITEMDAGKIILQKASLKAHEKLNYNEAELFLRRSEQHLLREFTFRVNA
jgi:phosphoribosylglycinamide formyltransferase-1